MPVIEQKGLKGLRGLGDLSKTEYDAFVERNKALIAQHNYDPSYISSLYNNKLFIDKYGMDAFKSIPDASARNAIMREDNVNEAIAEKYQPTDTNPGAGDKWNTIAQLSVDAKEELLNSDWKTPDQLKKEQEDRTAWWEKGIDFFAGEAIQRHKEDSNQKILDRIYNNDADNAGSRLGNQISVAYANPDVTGRTDSETKKLFVEAITPSATNMGISEYASHYGKGTEDDITSEMEDFSIDEMRQVLAKKAVYDQYMTPQMASTALNNEAKRYIKDHQSGLKKFGLFAKDVGISVLSYTADKVNGIYNLGLRATDAATAKPIVWVDDNGEVVDTTKHQIVRRKDGSVGYRDENGTFHSATEQEIARTTLHNLGKNMDGSDADEGVFHLNPVYWTRAEQFGTLDSDEQKQYEKLGSSPYKVVYDPNDDRDLWYESFKMMSFGIADAASMLLPFGVGVAGRALSTASKVGKIGRGFGTALNKTGRALTFETKTGRVAQGLAGAGGIAYAYQRGAFQETLAENLAKAEESLMNKSKKEIFDSYQNNKEYKAQVDSMIDARAAQMKAEYMAQMQGESGTQILDEAKIDEMLRAKAQDEVVGELVNQRFNEGKQSKEFAALQNEAINSAGDAAFNSFLPEAIKYGLVNTVGFRSFLYSNPASLVKRASKNFAGLTEKTLEGGAKRMDVASRFATVGDKMKQFGKVAAAQAWGGAWTNGTDDMMVDAAERINQDSFQRYLNAFETGETVADTYGLAESLYSYWRGLQNSMGQETTWDAAIIGGVGSIVSASPNMANIAHLATREGRQAFKENLTQRPVFENGKIQRDEQGNPVMEDVNWRDNWLERANYFIQNGVLNNYFGKKANERELQLHADYINQLLDREEDFKVLGELIASDMGLVRADLNTKGDEKTARYIKALDTMISLDRLGNDAYDPATLSSKVMEAKSLIERAARLGTNQQKEDDFSEEELNNLIGQYYSQHKGLEQSDENNQIALQHIQKNAQELQEAFEAYNKAGKEIKKIEKNQGKTIDETVKRRLQKILALNGHWEDRLTSMKDAIGDASVAGEVSIENLIPTIGSKKSAEALVNAYDKQEKELSTEMDEQLKKTEETRKEYQEAQKARKKAVSSDEVLQTKIALELARAKYEDSQMQEKHLDDMITKTKAKKSRVKQALSNLDESAESKILTADEIFALDPVTRAQMMNPLNRSLYSKEQVAEIEKLEAELKNKDSDALQKIQDISLLTQRIATNKDAYHKISENPTAAAIQFESQIAAAADAAVKLINYRSAQSIADIVMKMDSDTQGMADVTQESRNAQVYMFLRKHANRKSLPLLDIIKEENMLPKYLKQLEDANSWGKTASDITDIIDGLDESDDWKRDMQRTVDTLTAQALSGQDIIDKIEKAIDDVDNPQLEKDFEKIMKGLENLNYVRDNTVVESREQRRKRESEAKKKLEEENKRVSEAANAAAEKAAEAKKEEEKKKQEEDEVKLEAAKKQAEEQERARVEAEKPKVEVPANGEGLKPVETMEEGNSAVGAKPISDEVSVWDDIVNTLLEDGAEDGSVDVGRMWVRSGSGMREEPITAELSHNKIHISTAKEVQSFGITPNDWVFSNQGLTEAQANEKGITKETPVTVKSIEKIDGDWYFNGIFADSSTNVRLKMSDSFDLHKAIEKEKLVREAEAVEKGFGIGEVHLEEDAEGRLMGNSPTVTEQAHGKKLTEGEELVNVGQLEDTEQSNDRGNEANDTQDNTLSGMSFPEWVHNKETENARGRKAAKYNEDLVHDGVLVHKRGAEDGDSMNRFFSWLNNFVDANGVTGTKIQEIIDNELGEIIAANDTPVKVKFMTVRQYRNKDTNVTDDAALTNKMMLVIDYDNAINPDIVAIHNKNNGGVIESDGKKYLIIGVAGWGKQSNTDRQAAYDLIFRQLTIGRANFFNTNPSERFFVHPTLETEIVPGSLIPGWIVKQQNNEDGQGNRTIQELLDDNRNPQGLELEDLAWGIQLGSDFLSINTRGRVVMRPANAPANVGRVFVLVPAANGKLVPSAIEPRKYIEMNEGTLKDRIDNAVRRLGSPQYKERYAALTELLQLLYLHNDHDSIRIPKSNNDTIIFKQEGVIVGEVSLKSDNLQEELMDAFRAMNPRINVTKSVLSIPSNIREYDAAGVLQTDIARLGTAGATYSIYALNSEGKILKNDALENSFNRGSSNRNEGRTEIVFKGERYKYNDATKQYLTPRGEVINDADVIEQLQYNRRIIEGALIPSSKEGKYNFYILSAGEHPEVIKVDHNSKRVERLSDDKAIEYVEELERKKAEEERKKAAKDRLDDIKDAKLTGEKDIDLGEEVATINPVTGTVESQATTKNPLDILLKWVKGEISYDDSMEQLKKLEIIPPPLRDKDPVWSERMRRKREEILGDYITKKYPFLTTNDESVATTPSVHGGMQLLIVKDSEGNEYGSPSNFLRNESKYLERINSKQKGKKEEVVTQKPTTRDTFDEHSVERKVTPQQGGTQDFKTLIRKKATKLKILKAIANKWQDSGITFGEGGILTAVPTWDKLAEFLRSKGVEVDAIGVSDANVAAWLHEIECK